MDVFNNLGFELLVFIGFFSHLGLIRRYLSSITAVYDVTIALNSEAS